MAKEGLNSEQKSQIFRKFGYGIARFFAGKKLRQIIDDSYIEETKNHKDQVFELRHAEDPNHMEVAFNGDCARLHYLNIAKGYSVGLIHDKDSNKVEIVPKTLYKKQEDGSMKMIDMKKTGFWPFRKSALEYDCGSREDYKEILNNYKNAKILAYSDPSLTDKQAAKRPEKYAAAMVNGRPHGKTSFSKAPNSLFNTAIWYAFPILNLVFGFRESPSKTKSLRHKLLDSHVKENSGNLQKIDELKETASVYKEKALELLKETKEAKKEAADLKEQLKKIELEKKSSDATSSSPEKPSANKVQEASKEAQH